MFILVTYDLKGKEKNSKKYYETAREISKKIVRNIMITGEDFLSDYMKYIEDNKIEKYIEEIKVSIDDINNILKEIQKKNYDLEKEQFQMRMMIENLDFLIRKK